MSAQAAVTKELGAEMLANVAVGINPLPWILHEDFSFHLDIPTLNEAFSDLASLGFRAVQADIPDGVGVPAYLSVLESHGLRPAPGYFSAAFDAPGDLDSILEDARRHAAQQAALGLTEVFLACALTADRMGRPAVGFQPDADRLKIVAERVGRTAEVIGEEGVRPCLHQHVGSPIETEDELRAVLEAVPASVLAFGPDTGHLTWAGMDPIAMMSEFAGRIGGVHLKDMHTAAVSAALGDASDYIGSTVGHHVYTEPGRGDIDLDGVLESLPDDFAGWLMIEVDVPDGGTPLESSSRTAGWLDRHPVLSSKWHR